MSKEKTENPGLKQIIEASLFVSNRPLGLEELARICGYGNIGQVRKELENLIQEYRNRNSAIEIRKTTEGYQMTVKEELESYVIDLVTKTELPKALIKTLAFIAYKEPVPQSEVIKVRGNRAYHYIKELIAKGFIEAKKKGKTKVLCTTKKFKEYFQVEKLENAR